jgi:hypothetical protein
MFYLLNFFKTKQLDISILTLTNSSRNSIPMVLIYYLKHLKSIE